MSHPGSLWFATAVSTDAATAAASFNTLDAALNWLTTLAENHTLSEVHAVQQHPHAG